MHLVSGGQFCSLVGGTCRVSIEMPGRQSRGSILCLKHLSSPTGRLRVVSAGCLQYICLKLSAVKSVWPQGCISWLSKSTFVPLQLSEERRKFPRFSTAALQEVGSDKLPFVTHVSRNVEQLPAKGPVRETWQSVEPGATRSGVLQCTASTHWWLVSLTAAWQ